MPRARYSSAPIRASAATWAKVSAHSAHGLRHPGRDRQGGPSGQMLQHRLRCAGNESPGRGSVRPAKRSIRSRGFALANGRSNRSSHPRPIARRDDDDLRSAQGVGAKGRPIENQMRGGQEQGAVLGGYWLPLRRIDHDDRALPPATVFGDRGQLPGKREARPSAALHHGRGAELQKGGEVEFGLRAPLGEVVRQVRRCGCPAQ